MTTRERWTFFGHRDGVDSRLLVTTERQRLRLRCAQVPAHRSVKKWSVALVGLDGDSDNDMVQGIRWENTREDR